MSELTRRTVLKGLAAGAAGVGLGSCVSLPAAPLRTPGRRLDIHVHLFGNGDGGSGCFLSKRITKGLNFAMLIRLLGLQRRGTGLDRSYADTLAEQVADSGLERVAILAQDCVYDRQGRPDMARTHFFVPNDYLFSITDRHPRMTPCVSINPDRRDCLDELERCVEKGARLLKIHPPTQGVDVADRKHTRFFRRCAELDVLVMAHTGHEHAAPVIDISLADPRRLALALESGCRVVACHSGTGWPGDRPDYFAHFLAMVQRYPALYGDTSVMATLARAKALRRTVATVDCHDRFLHGSDFPFPSWPIAFSRDIGLQRAQEIHAEPSLIRRDYLLKDSLGIGQASAERAYRLVFGDDADEAARISG